MLRITISLFLSIILIGCIPKIEKPKEWRVFYRRDVVYLFYPQYKDGDWKFVEIPYHSEPEYVINRLCFTDVKMAIGYAEFGSRYENGSRSKKVVPK